MSFSVKFTATVTGTISDLDVLIQNELVDSPGGKVNVTEDYDTHGNLNVRFKISGLNGTDFKIVYRCVASGSAASDPANPTPVEDTIERNNFKEMKLVIPI